MDSTPDQTILRELDHRRSDSIEVRLLWSPSANIISVCVRDERSRETLAFNVRPAEALEAFHHPHAYADRTHESTRPLARADGYRRIP